MRKVVQPDTLSFNVFCQHVSLHLCVNRSPSAVDQCTELDLIFSVCTLHTQHKKTLDNKIALQIIDFFLLQELEVNIIQFVRHELKRHKSFLSSKYLGGAGEDGRMVDESSREAFLKITLNFLKINNADLANCLQSSKGFRAQLT